MTGDAKGPRRRRSPAGLRLFLLGTVAVVLVAVTGVVVADLNGPPDESPAAAPLATPARLHRLAGEPGQPGPDGDPQRSTLVLYEATGDDPQLAHENAVQAANLASRGGRWTMRPVEEYRTGDMRAHQGVIYVGLSSTNPLPPPFLADIAAGTVPVLWMGENIEQLFGAQPRKAAAYGWRPVGEDTVPAPVVSYRGRDLLRREPGEVPLERVELTARGPAQVLGTARRDDGTTTPWAVTAGALTYITEVPFSYVDNGDRYLAAADLVLRLVAPDAPERRRALIRIEDVGPNTDPEQIRAHRRRAVCPRCALQPGDLPLLSGSTRRRAQGRGGLIPAGRHPGAGRRAAIRKTTRRQREHARLQPPVRVTRQPLRRHQRQ